MTARRPIVSAGRLSPVSATATAVGAVGSDARAMPPVDPAVSHPGGRTTVSAATTRRRRRLPAVVTCVGVGQPRLGPSSLEPSSQSRFLIVFTSWVVGQLVWSSHQCSALRSSELSTFASTSDSCRCQQAELWGYYLGVAELFKLPLAMFTYTARKSQNSQECKKFTPELLFVPRDLELWPFDPKINRFPRLIVQHFYVKFGDPSRICFYPRDAMQARYLPSSRVRLSVCLSVR